MEFILASLAWFLGQASVHRADHTNKAVRSARAAQRSSGDSRVANRTLRLALKVRHHVLLEERETIDDAPSLNAPRSATDPPRRSGGDTHPERQDLLHAEHPRPPAVLRDADARRVRDLDRVQGPVGREPQPELERVLVDGVRRGHLVHGARDLDRQVLVRELGGDGRVFDVRELRADDRGREVARRVRRHGRVQLAVPAVGEPAADEPGHYPERAIVEMRGKQRQPQRRVRGGH